MAQASALIQALAASLEEALLLAALLSAAGTIAMIQKMDTLDMNLWVIVLVVQSIPYAATLLVAVVSGIPRLPARLVDWRSRQAST